MKKSVYGSGKASKLTEFFPSLFSNLTLFFGNLSKIVRGDNTLSKSQNSM